MIDKLYVPVVTLLTNGHRKQLDQLKSGFIITINQDIYKLKVTIQQENPYLHCLIDSSFPGVNGSFILSFSVNAIRTGYAEYFIPTAEIKDYNVMIHGQIFFG